MIFLAVNFDGTEVCSNYRLFRSVDKWTIIPNDENICNFENQFVYNCAEEFNYDNLITILPKGSIKKLTGIDLKWENKYIKII